MIDAPHHGRQRRHVSDDIVRRALITVVALLVFRLALAVPLPGLALTQSLSGPIPILSKLSIAAVALSAWMSVVAIAELLVLVLPVRWTKSIARNGHADPFARFLVLLTIVVSAIQGFGLAMALQDMPGSIAQPGNTFVLTTSVSSAAGTALAIVLARLIERAGLGRGFWVLLAAIYATSTMQHTASAAGSGGAGDASTLLPLALGFALIVLAVATLVLARRRAGHDAVEPVVWPLLLAGLLIPWIAILFGLLAGAQDAQMYLAFSAHRPVGMVVLASILALLCLRYAAMEGSQPFFWPTLAVLFAAGVAAQMASAFQLFHLPSGLAVLAAAVGTAIVLDVKERQARN